MRISDWSSDVCSSDLEWGRFGVRVNCIAPAGLSPAHIAQEEANPEFGRRLRKAIALGYVGDPEEDIGGAVLMLCSDESRYITGMTIFADGGLHLTPLALFDLSAWDEQHSSFNPTHAHAIDRKSKRLNSSHSCAYRMTSSA